VLSNEDIHQLIETGELQVAPFKPSMVRACGITLHLGTRLMRPLPGKVVDVRAKITPDYEAIEIGDTTPFELKPNTFVLGHTYQKVSVGDSIGFLIEGRSTLARVGLTIVQTAMLVYPGHRNRAVTLELANHGPNSILLYPKMKIARVVLFRLNSPSTTPYDIEGKYRKQEEVGPPIFGNEFLDEESE
jgi:dCTP deaminase